MGRKNLIRTAEHPYHVTTRSNNKEWFPINIDKVWEIANKLIIKGKIQFKIKVEAFVLMNNHYHMLIYTPDANIDLFMQFFNKNLALGICKEAARINHVFGNNYKWNIIESQAYYFNVLRYIYQNPIRAGLTSNCYDYQFSDIRNKQFDAEMVDWLNHRISEPEIRNTKRNLKKFVIKKNS